MFVNNGLTFRYRFRNWKLNGVDTRYTNDWAKANQWFIEATRHGEAGLRVLIDEHDLYHDEPFHRLSHGPVYSARRRYGTAQ